MLSIGWENILHWLLCWHVVQTLIGVCVCVKYMEESISQPRYYKRQPNNNNNNTHFISKQLFVINELRIIINQIRYICTKLQVNSSFIWRFFFVFISTFFIASMFCFHSNLIFSVLFFCRSGHKHTHKIAKFFFSIDQAHF